jgi:hypothetical protein
MGRLQTPFGIAILALSLAAAAGVTGWELAGWRASRQVDTQQPLIVPAGAIQPGDGTTGESVPAPIVVHTVVPAGSGPRRGRTNSSPSADQQQLVDAQAQAAQEAAQRQKDAELLKQQQAESQRQQQQQDQQAAALVREKARQANEPRIQEAPTQSGMTPVPVPETDQGPARIHDTPIPPPSNPPQPPPAQPSSQQ